MYRKDADGCALTAHGTPWQSGPLVGGNKEGLFYLCQRSRGRTHLDLSRLSMLPYIHRGPSLTTAIKHTPHACKINAKMENVINVHNFFVNPGNSGYKLGESTGFTSFRKMGFSLASTPTLFHATRCTFGMRS